ncbi:NUDIX domain-containing protein [Antribacter gilvus]|uniref:NUDIX domain-containing protein n=1 Tax=Antribacter gilvus TaxID=2304675 RepID=UPI000F772F44
MHGFLEDWDWAQTVVRFTDQRPPDEIVQSVRAIALVDDRVVVCAQAEGGIFLPGGTREPGETVDGCLRRELLEEAGFRVDGEPNWFAAHCGVSYHSMRYRPHCPFPLKSWLWGSVHGEFVSPPTNPPGAEQVVLVTTLPPRQAVEALAPLGRGYSQALEYWLTMGGANGA